MSEPILEVRHLGKSFGRHEVLCDVDEFIVLFLIQRLRLPKSRSILFFSFYKIFIYS